MPYYELLCLASGRLSRNDLSAVLRKTCRAFMDNGGAVTRVVPLGAVGNGPRKLAYRIRQNQVTYDSAFFVNVCAFASPATVSEVSRQLHIDERVLRHGVFRKPTMDCLRPIPDVTDPPAVVSSTDPDDPDYELRKFVDDFRKEYPDGFTVTEVEQHLQQQQQQQQQGQGQQGIENDKEGAGVEDDAEKEMLDKQEESVNDILAQLKGISSTPSASSKPDLDLSWLTDRNTPDSPPPKS